MAAETSKARSILPIANLTVAVLFLISAATQYNDPDPLPWILIYGAAGTACLVRRPGPVAWMLPAIVGAVALIWAVVLAPDALPGLNVGDLMARMEDKTPAIELGREFLGLLLVTGWMAFLVTWGLRSRNR